MPASRKISHARPYWRIVRAYFKGRCEDCGRIAPLTNGRAKFHLHHKDGNPENNNLTNLTLLCVKCHRRAHRIERSVVSLRLLEKWGEELLWEKRWALTQEQQATLNLINTREKVKEVDRLAEVEEVIRQFEEDERRRSAKPSYIS